MMKRAGLCSGIENYSRFLSGRGPGEPPPTLFDYLPADGLLVIGETLTSRFRRSAGCTAVTGRVKRRWWSTGSAAPSALDNRPMKFEEFEALAPQTIYVSATPGNHELEKSGDETFGRSGGRPDRVARPNY